MSSFSRCKLCPAGTWGDKEGETKTSCSGSCEAGRYSLDGQTRCLKCGYGSFTHANGAAKCVSCPTGRTSDQKEASTTCVCLKGNYERGVTNYTSSPSSSSSSSTSSAAAAASSSSSPSSLNDTSASQGGNGGGNAAVVVWDGVEEAGLNAVECVRCPEGFDCTADGATIQTLSTCLIFLLEYV